VFYIAPVNTGDGYLFDMLKSKGVRAPVELIKKLSAYFIHRRSLIDAANEEMLFCHKDPYPKQAIISPKQANKPGSCEYFMSEAVI
jgi:hypothetical protein